MILAAQEGGNALASFIPLILIAVAFYFFLIRPQKKRQQEQQKMQSSLHPGTRVVTSAGIYGTVLDTDEGDILLEIAEGVEIRVLAQAVLRVVEDVDYVVDEEVSTGAEDGVELTKGTDGKSEIQAGDKG
ncbi:preprotein translocase subunit YajC [Actinocorallia sp. API 0066]|uniref:preprotein translocase subunit YajC n=1 Tax=Actinocorallia sp. API 0066 TaxID=2896846 RepID=UPI001E5A855D|nr:preprotein translocase subunit YajC [Actinocorallia sp. API 0066]MCD0448987.1 preprotein translocase subunit YajC [Actinocorallia sp. API 0066]